MSRKEKPPVSAVRSSAAEDLTFVAATGAGQGAVEMRTSSASSRTGSSSGGPL